MEINEQISFDSLNSSDKSELDVFEQISKLIKEEYSDQSNMTLKENKLYHAICFFDVPKLRIRIVRKEVCLEIPEHFSDEMKEHSIEAKLMSDHYFRVVLHNGVVNSNIKSLIFDIYEYCYRQYSEDRFDCCSKYLECSDNRKCLYEGQPFSRACSYRYTMTKKKKIFYGKNRNV